MIVPATPDTLGASAVVNSGSYRLGALSPGEIVTIFGAAVRPAISGQFRQGLPLPLTLEGTQVLFDGQPVPLVYASLNQISAVVPYSVASHPSTTLQITRGSDSTNIVRLPVTDLAPGLFAFDASGSGQAAAVNDDDTYNSVQNPAPAGSTLRLFLTGEGVSRTSQAAGSVALPPYATPAASVSALVDGVNAQVVYAGGGPGTYAGFIEVMLRVPSGIRLNQAVPVVIKIGDVATQPGMTIAAK
jgi:uncharacterized protein (TIGR03437 family)